MQTTCGYVPHKLLKTEVGLKADHCAECHGNLSVAGEDVTDIPMFGMLSSTGMNYYHCHDVVFLLE